jgi:hypothetical protein
MITGVEKEICRNQKKEVRFQEFEIDRLTYILEVYKRRDHCSEAIPVLVPTYMPNPLAAQLTSACLASLKKYADPPIEIWLIDNGSPAISTREFINDDAINVVLNKTEPVAPRFRGVSEKLKHWLKRGIRGQALQSQDISYANAIGLELGIRMIPEDSDFVVTLHSDTLVLDPNWLSYLLSKFSEKVRISAFRQDPGRVRAAHIGGMVLDFQLYRSLGANFFHNMRQERHSDRPEYDVGDFLSIAFQAAGFDFFIARNTFNSPDLNISEPDRTILEELPCDICINDDNRAFFAHLGRGSTKSFGIYSKGLGPKEWIEIADILNG